MSEGAEWRVLKGGGGRRGMQSHAQKKLETWKNRMWDRKLLSFKVKA